MNEVIINGALVFSKVDCPTRTGELVDRVEDIYLIQNARTGMLVYAKETGETYIIKKLKEAVIDGVVVENAAVAEFEIFKDEAVMKQYVLDAIDDDKYYAHEIELKVGALLEDDEPADVKEFAYTMMIDKPFKIEVNGEYYIRQFKKMDLNGKVVEFVGEMEESVLHAEEVGCLYQVAFVHKDLFEAPFSQEELAQVVKFFGIKKEIPLVGYLGYYNSWEEFNEKLNSFTEAGYWHANVGKHKVVVYNHTAGNVTTQVASGWLRVENGALTGLITDYTSYKRTKTINWSAWTLANKVSINSVVDIEKLRAEQAEADIVTRLALEEERAVAAEGSLEEDITAEQRRATEAENVLDGKISDETNRAIKKERDIVDRINNLVIGNIAGLEGLDLSDYAKKTELQEAVTAEQERAEQAEAAIAVVANQNKADIEAEVTRATKAEKQLDVAVKNLSNNINGFATKEEVEGKQDTIYDLTELRSNSRLGRAAHDSLVNYATKANLAEVSKDIDLANNVYVRLEIGELRDGNAVTGGSASGARLLTEPIAGTGVIAVGDDYQISKYLIMYEGEEVVDNGDVNDNVHEIFIDEDISLRFEIVRKDGTAFGTKVPDDVIKYIRFKPIDLSRENIDWFVYTGEYRITGNRTRNEDGLPISNIGKVEGTLKVLADYASKTATQVLTLLNVGGGDGNVYTRTFNGGKWSKWGKLQTNIELSAITDAGLKDILDNGMYSGVLSDTGETFVLVVINNYAVATQTGYGGYKSQLLYSVDLQGNVKVKTRRMDAYGNWSDWFCAEDRIAQLEQRIAQLESKV